MLPIEFPSGLLSGARYRVVCTSNMASFSGGTALRIVGGNATPMVGTHDPSITACVVTGEGSP